MRARPDDVGRIFQGVCLSQARVIELERKLLASQNALQSTAPPLASQNGLQSTAPSLTSQNVMQSTAPPVHPELGVDEEWAQS